MLSSKTSTNKQKNAEIIAIGSELLTPQRVDTNSLIATEYLNALGVEVIAKSVVGDHRERLTEAIRTAIRRAHIVILIGGLGPTEDDLTREAAAAALNRKLFLSTDQEAILVQRFRRLNRAMAPNNLQQAYLIEGAEAIENPNGTAPGQFVSTAKGALALLPGPPREFKAMMAEQLTPRLRAVVPPQAIRVRSFRITGIGESDLDALIAPVYSKYENPVTTVLSSPGDLFVHLRARCGNDEEAAALLREVGDPIAKLLGDRVYSEANEDTLDVVVARMLRQRKASLAVAESFSGGMLSARLTDAAGASDFFLAGYVTYTDRQKQEVLGVPKELLERYTAVSEQVAAAMAEGARKRSGATFALATTGYAGPSGGTDANPAGTVYLAVASAEATRVIRLHYGGDRYRTRMLGTQAALDLLRKTLMGG